MNKKTFILLIILILTLPYLIGYNTEKHFSGLIFPTDGNTYLSFMNQAKEGHFLFTNMYTSEEVPHIMFRPTYLVMGWISLIVPGIVVYQLFRILAIIFFLYFAYKIIELFFKKENEKLITMVILLFASGIGFFFRFLTLFGIKQYGSIDMWITDANNFLLLLTHPHNILSLALMTGSIYYIIKWFKSQKLKPLIISGSLALLLGFEHIFDVITIYFLIGLVLLDEVIRKKKIDFKKIKQLLVFALITVIPFIYTLFMFTYFPEFSSWNQQNILDTPKFLHIIFGYGFMFFSFVAFVFHYASKKKIKLEEKIMMYWVFATLILVYFPLNIQRRFFEGLHIPFAIITAIFLFKIMPKYLPKKFPKQALIISLLVIMIPTNIYHYYNFTVKLDNNRGSFPHMVARYLEKEEHEALLWLRENIEPESIILSTYNIGNYIPRYMNNRVYLGHWAQTIDFEQKALRAEDYYKDMTDVRSDFPYYVWYGVDEKEINPEYLGTGEIVFENERVTIYKVK